MGIMDKFSRSLGFSSDEDERESDSQDKEEIRATPIEPKEEPPVATHGHASNVVDFSSAVAFRDNAKGIMIKSKITTIRPKTFDEDAQTIANSLREQIPVIINLENTESKDAQRIIDFISGTVYALNGTLKKVSNQVFISAPNNVTVTYTEDVRKTDGNSWMNK